MIQQLQHMSDVLCILNYEIQLHIEFASDQLQQQII